MEFSVKAIGYVESPLRSKEEAPKQGEEGSPLAVLVFDESVKDALESIQRARGCSCLPGLTAPTGVF